MAGYLSNVRDYQEYARTTASLYGVPESIMMNVIGAESAWDARAYNRTSGAAGLGQILASTGAQPGYGIAPVSDRFDPAQSITFVGQYLSALRERFGSWTAALQRYTGSPTQASIYTGNPVGQQAVAAAAAADGQPVAAQQGFMGRVWDRLRRTVDPLYGAQEGLRDLGLLPRGEAGEPGSLQDYAVRGIVGVLAIGLVLLALYLAAKRSM